mmetsp:Transcript_41796/g.75879  ORF Transcript_41796/g.75879 Transcript_41796/m.75879 type:complete len:780 (-) Transcript_41796:13-2352(-)
MAGVLKEPQATIKRTTLVPQTSERPGTQGGSTSSATSTSLSTGDNSKRLDGHSRPSSANASHHEDENLEQDEAAASMAMLEREARTQKCMDASFFLTDWVLNVTPLLCAARETLEMHSYDLQYYMEAVWNACRNMNTLQWEQFCDHILTKVRKDDRECFTSFFAHIEPGWRQTLTSPKELGPGVCNFLYAGTIRMPTELCEVLTRLGWTGVCLCPIGPSNEEYLQTMKFVQVDMFSQEGASTMKDLWSASGGAVPRPRTFQLVIMDLIFHTDEEEKALQDKDESLADDDELLGGRSKQSLRMEAMQDAAKAGDAVEPGRHPMNFGANEDLPETASGYGKLGVTRTDRARIRLQVMHIMLTVCMVRLHPGGSMVLVWPGLPFHPTLLFIMAYLRPVFQRVHVVTPPGLKTFETFIVAHGFKRDVVEAQSSSENPGYSFSNFLVHSPYRRNGLDDVLLWTLTDAALLEEFRVTNGNRSKSHGYDELFKTYGDKIYALAQETLKGKVRSQRTMGRSAQQGREALSQSSHTQSKSIVGGSSLTSSGSSGAQAKAKAKAAAKQAPKRRKKKVKKADAAEEDNVSAYSEDDVGESNPLEFLLQEEERAQSQEKPAEVTAKPKAGVKRRPLTKSTTKQVEEMFKSDSAPGLPPPAVPISFLRPNDKFVVKGPGRTLRLLQAKSQPQLACSLIGAAPGLRGPADPANLGATWPAVSDAFNYMEAGGTRAYFFRKAYEKHYGMEAPISMSNTRGSTATNSRPKTNESADAFRDKLIPAALRMKTPPTR